MRNEMSTLIVSLMLVTLLSAQSAVAQTYPREPLQIIVPYTAGGEPDLLARVIGNLGSKYLGQPIVTVNKTGAAGAIAAADVVSSKPDGYKVLLSAQVFFATTAKMQKLPFDPNDLVPLANFIALRFGLVVRTDPRFKTFDGLLSYGKKNLGQLRWGHPGRGTTLHMMPMIIFKRAGVQTIDVPYKGSPEIVTALLGGHVDAASLVVGAVADQVRAGKVKFLMHYAHKRYEDFPDVPTATELGYADAVLPTYMGLYVHKNTPESIKKTLMDLCKKVYFDPQFKKGLEKLDMEPMWGGPEFIKEAVAYQEKVGIPILKEFGLYVEK